MYILLTGGKTMGHISPLLCIYKEFCNENDILYLGLKNSMEEETCKRLNIPFYGMELFPFYRKNIFKNFKTFYYIFKERRNIRKKFKKVDIRAIISSGGYVSVPLLLAFPFNNKIKKILLEPNTTMGLANKILSLSVNKIVTQFPTIKNKKVICAGNPITIEKSVFDHPFFYSEKKKILFVGGSNGALEIVKIAYKFNQMFPNVIIFVITGFRYYETYQFNQNARVYKKINNISSIFNRFDLIVSRAGASTIAEILATNSVAVLFPSKNVSANHQVKNAQYLKNLAAVEMILNLDDESVQTIYSLLNDEEKRKLIKSNSNAIFLKDSLNELRKVV